MSPLSVTELNTVWLLSAASTGAGKEQGRNELFVLQWSSLTTDLCGALLFRGEFLPFSSVS